MLYLLKTGVCRGYEIGTMAINGFIKPSLNGMTLLEKLFNVKNISVLFQCYFSVNLDYPKPYLISWCQWRKWKKWFKTETQANYYVLILTNFDFVKCIKLIWNKTGVKPNPLSRVMPQNFPKERKLIIVLWMTQYYYCNLRWMCHNRLSINSVICLYRWCVLLIHSD